MDVSTLPSSTPGTQPAMESLDTEILSKRNESKLIGTMSVPADRSGLRLDLTYTMTDLMTDRVQLLLLLHSVRSSHPISWHPSPQPLQPYQRLRSLLPMIVWNPFNLKLHGPLSSPSTVRSFPQPRSPPKILRRMLPMTVMFLASDLKIILFGLASSELRSICCFIDHGWTPRTESEKK